MISKPSRTHGVVFKDLFNNGKQTELGKGEILHRSDEKCQAIGLVVSGEIRLSRVLSTGKEVFLKNFRTGDLFADLIVFTAEHYPGWLIASEPSRVVEVKRSRVLDFIGGSDALISYLYSVSQKMTHLSRTIEILSLKTVREKIAFSLLNEEPGSRGISINVTRFAENLNCSREAVSRALSAMDSEGILKRKDGILFIRDKSKLEAVI